MRAKFRILLDRCLEEGVEYGINRAYKHTETPTSEALHQSILDAIWLELDNYFEFEDE